VGTNVNFFSDLVDPKKKNRRLLRDLNGDGVASYFLVKFVSSEKSGKSKRLVLHLDTEGISFVDQPEKIDCSVIANSFKQANVHSWKNIPTFKFYIPLEEFRFVWEDPNGTTEKEDAKSKLPPGCTMFRFMSSELDDIKACVDHIVQEKTKGTPLEGKLNQPASAGANQARRGSKTDLRSSKDKNELKGAKRGSSSDLKGSGSGSRRGSKADMSDDIKKARKDSKSDLKKSSSKDDKKAKEEEKKKAKEEEKKAKEEAKKKLAEEKKAKDEEKRKSKEDEKKAKADAKAPKESDADPAALATIGEDEESEKKDTSVAVEVKSPTVEASVGVTSTEPAPVVAETAVEAPTVESNVNVEVKAEEKVAEVETKPAEEAPKVEVAEPVVEEKKEESPVEEKKEDEAKDKSSSSSSSDSEEDSEN
jgi:chemotaxis protein histidine kinase CheA